MTAGHIERRLLGRADARWHGTHQRGWRLSRPQIIDQRGAVLGAESQPLIGKLLIAFWTASHDVWSAATCRRFGLGRLDAQMYDSGSNEGRDRSRPNKAVTGHRTPKF